MIRNDYGIKAKPITVRNPQANAIVERIHQVLGNMIRSFELQTNYLDETDPWKGILTASAFAIRHTYDLSYDIAEVSRTISLRKRHDFEYQTYCQLGIHPNAETETHRQEQSK